MATKKTESAPIEAINIAAPTAQQIVNEGIVKVIEAHGIDVQKNRYKAMRAIAWEAFAQAIEAGAFDQLVTAAIKNVDKLPAGWEIETAARNAVKASPAKATTTKGRRAA